MHSSNKHEGERHGRLTLLYPVGYEKCHSTRWKVRCDCGKEFEAALNNVMSGNTKSCGCLRRERMINLNKSKTK